MALPTAVPLLDELPGLPKVLVGVVVVPEVLIFPVLGLIETDESAAPGFVYASKLVFLG